ncbi:MAG: SDR family NAD(P)-dependent oxidoreductase [Gemmatimonadota bacterium]
MKLSGRGALITGAGRGIGAETALALARAGARVGLAARNMDQVVETAARLREIGLEAFAFRCDVTKVFDVKNLALSARDALGQVDILVNAARTATSNPLGRITPEEWRHMLEVNATGTFLCTQALVSWMVDRGWGRVVNVASRAGLTGFARLAAFSASEHAVVGFTRALAHELDGSGVTVNAVCPGHVDTPLTDEAVAGIMREKRVGREVALSLFLQAAGQARLLRAAEVAEHIVGYCLAQHPAPHGEICEVNAEA